MKKQITICGSDGSDKYLSTYALETAERVGKLIAKKNGIVICGGHSGVMKAVCMGAKKENGLTVGITPYNKEEANEFVDIVIPTNIGNVRNYLVVNSGDVVIAIGGRSGTLNEISYAMISKKPLILIKGTGGIVDNIINGNVIQNIKNSYIIVDSAEEAVDKAFEL